MAQRLRDIDPTEVSLVQRGANRRRFSVVKTADSGLDNHTADVLALAADGEDRFLAELQKTSVDADTGRAVVGAYRLLKAHQDNLPAELAALVKAMDEVECADDDEEELDENGDPVAKADYTAEQRQTMASNGQAMSGGSYPTANRADLEKAIHAVGRGNAPHADIRAHIVTRARALDATDLLPDNWNVTKEDPDMTDTATVPVKKEDGTWDLTGVPEDQHDFYKTVLAKADRAETAEAEKAELEKAAADAKASEEDALKIAKEEREIRLTGVYVAKAAELGQSGEEFGPVLKSIADAVGPETFEKLESVLKANHERAETAGLYKEIGKAGQGANGSAQAQLSAKADEIRKADSSLTPEKALTKAYELNPDLYARMREEAS